MEDVGKDEGMVYGVPRRSTEHLGRISHLERLGNGAPSGSGRSGEQMKIFRLKKKIDDIDLP